MPLANQSLNTHFQTQGTPKTAAEWQARLTYTAGHEHVAEHPGQREGGGIHITHEANHAMQFVTTYLVHL